MSREKHIEEKVIEEMAKVLKDYTKKNNIMASHVILDDYAEALYNAGCRKQEWISVEDRLPMFGELVLVSAIDKGTGKHGWFYLASYDKRRKWWNGASFGHVTHWMPLPEAPKMKGGE